MRLKKWQLLLNKIKMTNSNIIKTGTTCIGLIFKDGVLLAADRRVTSYKIDSEKFDKVFSLSSHIVSTVSGGASDAQLFMRIIQSELKLIELKNERKPYVSEAAMILNSIQYNTIRTQGSIVGLILGGYDPKKGYSLYNLAVDGTIVPNEGYVTTGSGSIFVQGVLDNDYKANLSEKEALELIEKCFKTSFKNDNASGGGFVAKIITKDGVREASRKIIKTEFVKEV